MYCRLTRESTIPGENGGCGEVDDVNARFGDRIARLAFCTRFFALWSVSSAAPPLSHALPNRTLGWPSGGAWINVDECGAIVSFSVDDIGGWFVAEPALSRCQCLWGPGAQGRLHCRCTPLVWMRVCGWVVFSSGPLWVAGWIELGDAVDVTFWWAGELGTSFGDLTWSAGGARLKKA